MTSTNLFFYCSNEFETALAEVRPEKNQFITIAAFEPILKNGEIPKFNVKPICIQHLQKIKTITACAQDYDISQRPIILRELDNYLDTIFTETVSEETDYKYNLTIAITRCMLVDMIGENQTKVPIQAMLYPSILRNLTSSNILFKPKYIHSNFEIKHLQTFKVLNVRSNGAEIMLLRHGKTKGLKINSKDKLDIEWKDIRNGPQEFIKW